MLQAGLSSSGILSLLIKNFDINTSQQTYYLLNDSISVNI